MLDIDHFKTINDSYGHLVGDEVLKAFTDILKTQAHEHDFIGRWGGEEFMLILSDTDADSAKQYAEQLRQRVLAHHFNEAGKLTASFGVALSHVDDDITSLVKRADECLYQAKNNGRNQVTVAA